MRGVSVVMETVQIRLTERQIRNIRSEAVRDAVRKLVDIGME